MTTNLTTPIPPRSPFRPLCFLSSLLGVTLQPRRAMLGSARWGLTRGNAPWAPSSSGSNPLRAANHAVAGVSRSGDALVPQPPSPHAELRAAV